MTAPHHGSGPSMVLLCARLPSVSVRRFESVHPSPGQRDQRWREGKLKAQACYAANLVSSEHRAAREASKNIPSNIPEIRKCFHRAQKAQPYLILLHRQRVIQIGGMG
jgi:hypothetical protein